jgi:hypothetical protein
MKIAESTSYADQHNIGKSKRTQSLVLENRKDAERLKDELEEGDDPAKIAEVLGIEIIHRLRFGDIKPEKTVPDSMQEELDYAENKWYLDGERVMHLVSKPLNDGHKQELTIDEDYLMDWLGGRVLLKIRNGTNYNGLNPDTHWVNQWVLPEEAE